MPKDYLPIQVDPFRYAEHATQLHGVLHVKDMTRLRDSLLNDSGDVEVDLVFGKDEQGVSFMKGHLKTRLNLQCQRCMEPFVYEIMSDFLSGIVSTEDDARHLPERYDPVVVKEEGLALHEIIEDELILSLPIVSVHDLKDCKAKLPFAVGEGVEAKKDSPFKVIELLKTKRQE